MDPYEIGKKLLELASSLMGLKSTYAKDDRECRDRLSSHLSNVVECLLRIAETKSGQSPDASDCAELEEYLNTLKYQLESVLPPDRLHQFNELLQSSVNVRAFMYATKSPEELDKLKSAIGKFRALASEVKVA